MVVEVLCHGPMRLARLKSRTIFNAFPHVTYVLSSFLLSVPRITSRSCHYTRLSESPKKTPQNYVGQAFPSPCHLCQLSNFGLRRMVFFVSFASHCSSRLLYGPYLIIVSVSLRGRAAHDSWNPSSTIVLRPNHPIHGMHPFIDVQSGPFHPSMSRLQCLPSFRDTLIYCDAQSDIHYILASRDNLLEHCTSCNVVYYLFLLLKALRR